MIVVRIKGGLGNQLFQYASARGLASSWGHALKLDSKSGFYKDRYKRSYRLDWFGLQQHKACRHEVYCARALSWRRWLSIRRSESVNVLNKNDYFLSELSRKVFVAPLYLEAYLQSPLYFSNVQEDLRSELSPPSFADAQWLAYREQINAVNAVSVHVRRKDYARTLTPQYYKQAVQLAVARLSRPHFFLFGEDLESVVGHFSWLHPKTVVQSSAQDADLKDLALMASCKHHITANSTFSWWGAWLSGQGGLVIVPSWGWSECPSTPKNLFMPTWTAV